MIGGIFGNFFMALAVVVNYALEAYMWVVIIRALLSWVNPDPYNPIVRFIYNITEPVLYRIRRTIPVSFGGVDFTPMILILCIIFLQKFLVPTLVRFGAVLGA
ncbi:MAG: YggT family protein [Acidobacteriota bacterium]